MIRPTYKMGVAGALLSVGLIAGTGYASAHGKTGAGAGRAHAAPIKGVVSGLGSGNASLQVKTAGGIVTVNVTGTTHVVHVVTGSAADLAPNARVELHLVTGTTTVDAVRIEAAIKSQTRPTTSATKTRVHTPKPTTASTGTPRVATHAQTRAGGQIATVSGNTIAIRGRSGQTTNFTLANSVAITKVIAGTSADLAVGQTVQVVASTAGNALAITILNA